MGNSRRNARRARVPTRVRNSDEPPRPIWSDELTQLYLGDCIDVMRTLPTESVELCIADPPYCSGGITLRGRTRPPHEKYQNSGASRIHQDFPGDMLDQRLFSSFTKLWMRAVLRLLVPGGIFAVFTDFRQIPATTDAIQLSGLAWRGLLPWVKRSARTLLGRWSQHAEFIAWGTRGSRPLRGRAHRGYFFHPHAGAGRVHMAQKPLALLDEILEIVESADATVLDPFAGAGTTLIAARRRGLRSIGIEIDETIAKTAVQRLVEER